MPRRLTDYKGVLLDLDGTLVRQDKALSGAADLVRHLQQAGVPMLVVTNSTNGPDVVVERLAKAGMAVGADGVLTAAAAAVDTIAAQAQRSHDRRPRIFNLGQPDIDSLITAVGTLVDNTQSPCDAVLAGTPGNAKATDERRRVALQLLRDGAELVGVCADRIYPSSRGIEFGCGAFCAMLGYAAGVRARFCGKPERAFFDDALARLGHPPPGDVLIIGDNLEADILGGKAAGMRTGLVLGGVTRQRDIESLGDVMRPTFMVDDLPSLLNNLG